MEHEDRSFSVGELAQICGITVRTLQYYDRSGLLHASFTQGRRRVYSQEDLFKLQQILFLKSLGFPLEQIGGQILSENDSEKIAAVFEKQHDILQEQMANLQKRLSTLELAIGEAKEGNTVSLEKIMTILQLMKESNPYTFVVRYFSTEQIQSMAERFGSAETYQTFMAHASRVFADLGRLYAESTDPESSEAQKLAEDWWAMVREFSADNPQLLRTLISSGNDMENWPKEAGNVREMIQNLLSPALNRYLQQHNIPIQELKEGSI